MTDCHEWERDAAVWLAGRQIEAGRARPATLDADGPAGTRLARAMAGFRAWQVATAREAEAARFADEVRARVAGLGRGVRRVDRAPASSPAAVPGPLAATILAARQAHAAPFVEWGVAAGTGRELLDEPCDVWVSLPADLPPSRYVALRVVGDSMIPLLHSEDVVLVDLDQSVRPGAVAVARHPSHGYVVKRVDRAGAARPGVSLVSLNPAYPPVDLDPATGDLLGPVVLRWCAHPPAKPRLAPGP